MPAKDVRESRVRPAHRLSLDNIAESARSIDPAFRDTPQYDCEPLSGLLGCHLTPKLETANPIRCFKGRGADCFLSRVAESGGGGIAGPGGYPGRGAGAAG